MLIGVIPLVSAIFKKIVFNVILLVNAIGCLLYFLTNDLYGLDTHNAVVSEILIWKFLHN